MPLCCPLWDKVAVANVPQQFVSSQVGHGAYAELVKAN